MRKIEREREREREGGRDSERGRKRGREGERERGERGIRKVTHLDESVRYFAFFS